ncbi:MAG: DUF998 domain-containing protein [Litorimonas sp.]
MSNFLRAGFVVLPAWIILATIAGFFAGDYNPIASHVSVMTLEDTPGHFIANLAALIAGGSLVLFGLGLWRLSKRIFAAGALCWIVFGVSMIGNGIWPMGSPMHGIYIIGIFNVLAPALTLLDLRDSHLMRKLHGVTVFVSLMGVLYLWILLNGFDPEGYSGLTQRIFGSINYLWPFVFAWTYFRSHARP